MRELDLFRLERSLAMLLIMSSMVMNIQAQSIYGFVSIDCGSSTPYTDANTTISWQGDGYYTLTGTNGVVTSRVNSTYENSQALQTFQYFLERRSKHCYDLPTTGNISFLLRAMFLHGSSPHLIRPIKFDVAVNGTIWSTVEFSVEDTPQTLMTPYVLEGIFRSPGHLIHFCLLPDIGVPFISSLELRQLDPDGIMYYSFSGSDGQYFTTLHRINSGAAIGSSTVRYPADNYDRLWHAPGESLKNLSTLTGALNPGTLSSVNSVPPKVMQDAWVDKSGFTVSFSNSLRIQASTVYIIFYIQDIQTNATSGERVFNILVNAPRAGVQENITLTANTSSSIFPIQDLPFFGGVTMDFTAGPNPTLGPILNAIEIFSQSTVNPSFTAARDVDTLATLQQIFNLTDWQGDPCYPASWDWVKCTSDVPAKVDELLLSNMGIVSFIPSTILDLDSLTQIYLDNNSLQGSIPASLATLANLSVLSLNDNNLSGNVPLALINKLGSNFQYSGNALLGVNSTPLSTTTSTTNKKSKNIGIIAGGITGGICGLGIICGFICGCTWYFAKKKNLQRYPVAMGGIGLQGQHPVVKQERGYISYETVQVATNNFEREIGQGSYGPVYHGWLDDREVAVKVNTNESRQGHKEFLTEVDILRRVHHRNLVPLIAYCNEGNELILVYEYQVNGTLQEWLHDEANRRGTLDWKTRLQIAADVAKGLEYLHKGCLPTIIHRDVKSDNILLDSNMTGKVADFGLSKLALAENSKGFSTDVKGTTGYLDPEYRIVGRITHKSDVYSFGVVLAELITGCPPVQIQAKGENIILVQRLRELVERNDLESLADPNLKGAFQLESMWKLVDLTLACVDVLGEKRPDFRQVVIAINEAIEMEKQNTCTPLCSIVPPSMSIPRNFKRGQRYLSL